MATKARAETPRRTIRYPEMAMPANWVNGYRGDRKAGAYDLISDARSTSTARFTRPRVRSTKALANLAIDSISKATTTKAMADPVMTTPTTGVPNRLRVPIRAGRRPSRAIAIG